MFRKMSSHVDDIVLTSDDFHLSEYEKFLDDNGINAEVYIKQLMKSLTELIDMTDQDGNYIKIGEKEIRGVLHRNFGEIEGKKVLERWKDGKHQSDFAASLAEFNKRREYAFNGEYEQFLIDKYDTAHTGYFNAVRKITLTKILATRDNLAFLNLIYKGKYAFVQRSVQERIRI